MSVRHKDDDRFYYRCYPGKFLTGISRLDPDEIAAYAVVLNLIYDAQGPIADDSVWIAKQIGKSFPTRRWNKVRASLIEQGKLYVTEDGVHLMNKKAEIELKSAQKDRETFSELGHKSAETRRKKREEAARINDISCRDVENSEQQLESESQLESENVQLPPEEAVAAREAPRPGPMPRLSDPPGKWMHLTGHKGERPSDDMALHPVVNGWYLVRAAKDVCEAAGITDPNFRGDWHVLIEWLEKFHLRDEIIPAIRHCVAKYGGGASSLRRFDKSVTEQWQRKDRAA